MMFGRKNQNVYVLYLTNKHNIIYLKFALRHVFQTLLSISQQNKIIKYGSIYNMAFPITWL